MIKVLARVKNPVAQAAIYLTAFTCIIGLFVAAILRIPSDRPESPVQHLNVKVVGSVDDDGTQRQIVILTDRTTGKRYVGVTGIGVVETKPTERQ